jgi:O-acetylserine/cysteine efflux transporter
MRAGFPHHLSRFQLCPMTFWQLLIMVLLNVGWAGTIVINKALTGLPAGSIVTLRFALAALCMVLLWPLWRGPTPRGRDAVLSVLIGILVFVVGQRLQVQGVILGKASDSAVLMAVEPLLTSVAAALFLREHIGPRRLLGFLVSIAGVLVLNRVWRPDFQWTGLLPSLLFMSSFLCETAYSILGKPLVSRSDPAKILTFALLGATAVNLLWDGSATAALAVKLRPADWALLGYMAVICTVIGYSVWLAVIKHAPVNVVALTIFMQPLAGVPLAAAWLGDELHWGQLWGCLLILGGLILGLSRQIHAAATSNRPTDPPVVRP